MTARALEAERVRAEADELHDAVAVQAAYDELAHRVTLDYAGRVPLLLCVMVGGLVTTAELTRRLDFALELDYLHATRYRNGLSGGELEWKVRPATALRGREVLVVDDILDEGYTLAAILATLRQQQPASLRTLVLVEKRHERRAPGVTAGYIGLSVDDRYVFGCGMDYKGYYRQLPAIYAVKREA
jgi:hypoxanthine phosphoribosyltransferase